MGGGGHVTHFVACCCILGENPRPARMTDALIGRENNSFFSLWVSNRHPLRCLSSE